MVLTVEVKPAGSGVLLSRYDKNQQIFLPQDSWLQLVNFKDNINIRLENKQAEKWSLGNNIQVVTSIYKEIAYLNIRVYVKDKPTKQGVALVGNDWGHLSSFLHPDDETKLGITIYQEMVNHGVCEVIKDTCAGCQENWNSQKDHACLMEAYDTAHSCINDVFEHINIHEFITRLGKEAGKLNIIIFKPFDTFQLIKMTMAEQIKAKTLSRYDM